MVLFNKIQFSVQYLEACIKRQKKLDFSLKQLLNCKNKESNLFGQTFIFKRNSGRGQRNLFGYGSNLNKNSLFFMIFNKDENLNISLFTKYFDINKDFEIQENIKKMNIIKLLSILYQREFVYISPKNALKEIKGEEYTLEIKKTPYLHLEDNLKYTEKNYKILSRYCIHDFFKEENVINETNG